MLKELKVSNLGVIQSAELSFGPGLNVITGETGAGKTMILSALTQTLGEKTDGGLIRNGAPKLLTETLWQLSDSQQKSIGKILSESDIDIDLALGRSIDASGKSRTVLNGLTCSNSVIAQIADELVQIFGQNDQRFLTKSSWQLQVLDEYGDKSHNQLLVEYRKVYDKLLETRERLSLLQAALANWRTEKEQWLSEIAEFDQISPLPNEDDEILQQISVKERIEASLDYLRSAQSILNSDENQSLASLLNQLIQKLDRIEELVDYRGEVQSFIAVIADIEYRIASLIDQDDVVQSLSDLYSRKATLQNLIRKHALPLNEIITLMQQRREQLEIGEDPTNQIQTLALEEEVLHNRLIQLATELTRERILLADRISRLVTAELTELKMGGTRFIIESSPITKPTKVQIQDKYFDQTGADQITFLIAHGKQADPKPIAKTASGGELSRIMLSIHVVLQAAATDLTFIFDEVDAGIGGETAVEVGKRLKRLAERNQVLVVTHLPQVAAFADCHFLVQGDISLGIKTADVALLTQQERIAEIARMLGGMKDSAAALDHAKELLALRP